MKGSHNVWDIAVFGLAIAGIFVFTKPGSQGGQDVISFGRALTGFAQGVSGQKVTTLQ